MTTDDDIRRMRFHACQRAVFVMLANISQRAGKEALLHGGHGNQEVIGKIEIRHGGIVSG